MVKKVWYEDDFDVDSNSLICAFASNLIIPGKFEWANTWTGLYNHLKFKKIRLCDNNKSWYHTTFPGVRGYGPHSLSDFLRRKIELSKAKNIMFMGLSMGGYGAILLGSILKPDKVVAFSPQTYLTTGRYKKAKLDEKFEGLNIDENITDLKNVLENSANDKTEYHIYYAVYHSSDVNHAERISYVKDGTVGEIIKNFIEEGENK